MGLFDFWGKVQNYDKLMLKLNRTSNELEHEHEEKEKALDLATQLEDELRASQKEVDSLSYAMTKRNEANEQKIMSYKNRATKSRTRADKKLRQELKKKEAEIEKLKEELKEAKRLEWEYVESEGGWLPVHGSIEDIQNHMPRPVLPFVVVSQEKK